MGPGRWSAVADERLASVELEPTRLAGSAGNVAEVAVEAPVRRLTTRLQASDEPLQAGPATFHYAVPASLLPRLRPGQWVWVPFGPRHVSGIILSLGSQAPPGIVLREIAALIEERPVLSQAQLELGRWLSEYYLAPLYDCLRLFLPPGAAPPTETVYRLAGATARVSQAAEPVVQVLAAAGPLTRAEIDAALLQRARATPGRHRRDELSVSGSTLDRLVRRGIVERLSRLARPSASPRLEHTVRLALPPDAAWQRLAQESASNPRGRVLCLLAEAQTAGDPLLPVEDLRERAHVSAALLRQLAEEGLLTIVPGSVVLAATRQACTPEPALSPGAAALLEDLRKAGPTDQAALIQAGHGEEAIATLLQQGLAERHCQPEYACLAIPAVQAWQAVVAASRLPGLAAALSYLAEHPGALWLSELLAQPGVSKRVVDRLASAGVIALEQRRYYRDPFLARGGAATTGSSAAAPQPEVALAEEQQEPTADQAAVLEPILAAIREGRHEAFLLHGVTGSGKTEVYLQAISQVLALGKQAIALVPEIALTPQALRRFGARFPGRIAIQHSQLSPGERYDQWSLIRDGTASVVIGSRSALFAPVPNLGLIILDEEHDASYKQQESPHYHARDAALQLARLCGAVVVLGSATPDVTTYRAAERGTLRLLRLPARYGGNGPAPLPPVQIVDMRQELREGHTGLLSRLLLYELGHVLERGEQAILFLNRRGSATFVICRDCGYVARCPRCDLPLTYHSPAGEEETSTLVCHHCGYRTSPPKRCPNCASARIRYFGAGTERLEAYVHQVYPQARTLRWDRDTTRQRGGHDAILERFLAHEADVLIGTQMIAKGLDLPLVTIVGVVAADTALFLPDYRAGERAFQLLTQVAGRAGRSERGGRAIIQTYRPDHYAINAAAGHDYLRFYQQEIEHRRRLGYPPFGELARLLYVHTSAERCQAEAERLGKRLRLSLRQQGWPNLDVLGPMPCFYSRLRGRYRWHMILRGQGVRDFLRGQPLPLGWRVDVDPLDLL